MPEPVPGLPSPEDLVALRAAAGLGPRSLEAARRGPPNSLHSAVVREDGRLIAMGRDSDDDGLAAQIVDIAMHPGHQGRGLGTAIVAALMAWGRAELPATRHLGLIADPAAEGLHARAGLTPQTGMGPRL